MSVYNMQNLHVQFRRFLTLRYFAVLTVLLVVASTVFSSPNSRGRTVDIPMDSERISVSLAPESLDRQILLKKPAENSGKVCQWKGTPGTEDDQYPGFCESLIGASKENISTSLECKQECCESEECNGWQFREDLGCRFSTKKHHGWCEPTAPSPWTGQSIEERIEDGQCKWREKPQESQCKGLGSKKPETNPEDCAKACCANPTCKVYQYREDKGCFYGVANYCDTDEGPYAWKPFKGGRKITL
mmetsp:Transcript_9013/g.13488  ORF Transcript_9013/g.13488 Transcript_9013/m.13488 type:complete len:245 (+) Transcript_9013:44-778(+)